MTVRIPEDLNFIKFLSTGPLMVYVLNEEGKYVWTNKALQEFTGFGAEELLNLENFWEPLVHPEFQEMLKSNHYARSRGEDRPDNYEIKIKLKDGTEKWVDLFVTIEMIEGHPYTFFGAYDITARKMAQMELQMAHDHLDHLVQERTQEVTLSNHALTASQIMLQSVISNISDGVIILTSQGEIEFINRKLEYMLGNTLKTLNDQLIFEVLTSRNPSIKQLFMKQQAFAEEEVSLQINGREMQFLATGTPIEDSDGLGNKGILILKPLAEIHRLVNRYNSAQAHFRFADILTDDPIMLDTIEAARNAALNKNTILIEGESGTGKELFAQSIHNQSVCADGPFIAVNCGAIPHELVGSELFGYADGAYTGARKGGNPGKFELAQGGTLFLDEISDMPLEQQVALLRVLQEKQICRLGGSKTIPVDVRVICATQKHLFTEVQKGTFRQDLYYRINVLNLRIPPLRERHGDIELLLNYFLTSGDKQWLEHMNGIEASVWNLLKNYAWPGNVRELQNFAEKILYSVKDYAIRTENLPREILDAFSQHPNHHSITATPLPAALSSAQLPSSIKQQKAALERSQIKALLKQYNGNVGRVAADLGVSRRTVDRKINLYNIER